MNSKQIDCLLELGKTQNFNKAAENLYMSQPSLSYQISELEKEIGFKLFDRGQKGAAFTPAGRQFAEQMGLLRVEIRNAVEQGRNFSKTAEKNIRFGLSIRSSLKVLPQAIVAFESTWPSISVTPIFEGEKLVDNFLKGELDLIFCHDEYIKGISGIKTYPVYNCPIDLVCRKEDPLAKKKVVRLEDLSGYTLMVGGPSSKILQLVQNRAVSTTNLATLASMNHETTLTNVLSGKGICFSPELFKEKGDGVCWVKLDVKEKLPMVLCLHGDEKRKEVLSFVTLLQSYYPQQKLPFDSDY